MPGHSQVTRKVSDFEPILEQDPFAKPVLEPLNDADREEAKRERVAVRLGLEEPTPRDLDIFTTYAIDTGTTHQNIPGIKAHRIIGPELPPPPVLRASEAVRPIIITKAQRDAHKTWHIPQELSVWNCPLCAQDRRAEEARLEALKRPPEDPAQLAHARNHRYKLAFTCKFCQRLPEYEETFRNRIAFWDPRDDDGFEKTPKEALEKQRKTEARTVGQSYQMGVISMQTASVHARNHIKKYVFDPKCRCCQEEEIQSEDGNLGRPAELYVERKYHASIVDLSVCDVYIGVFRSKAESNLARHVAYKLLGSPRANTPLDCSPETFQHLASVTRIVTEKLRQHRLI